MDSRNKFEFLQLENTEEQFDPSDSIFTLASIDSIKRYIYTGDLYKINFTQSDNRVAIDIEFLQSIVVAKGERKEIELVDDLGIITIEYPGVLRRTKIDSTNEDTRVTIKIPREQCVIEELYSALLLNEPNIGNDFIECKVGIAYYPVVIPSIVGYYTTMCPFIVENIQLSHKKLIDAVKIECDLLAGYQDSSENDEVSLVADHDGSFFE